MGYTHYFYRPLSLNKTKFQKFSEDCRKIFDYCQNQLGIALANGMAEDGTHPEVTDDLVSFNGSDGQPAGVWTTNEQISIPWPSSTAGLTEEKADPGAVKTNGNWFAGDVLEQRCAPINYLTGKGSGSYETLYVERVFKLMSGQEKEKLYFSCCKTAFRPYDVAVTAVLISLKHHFPKIKVSTDGEDKDWLDAKILCNNILGYGLNFEIIKSNLVLNKQ